MFPSSLSIILLSLLIVSTIAQWSRHQPSMTMERPPSYSEEMIKATVFLFGSDSDVVGHLLLTQKAGEPLIIQGKIKGLSRGIKHGFHVHQFGDVFTEGCDSTGTHYNPLGVIIRYNIHLLNLIKSIIRLLTVVLTEENDTPVT